MIKQVWKTTCMLEENRVELRIPQGWRVSIIPDDIVPCHCTDSTLIHLTEGAWLSKILWMRLLSMRMFDVIGHSYMH